MATLCGNVPRRTNKPKTPWVAKSRMVETENWASSFLELARSHAQSWREFSLPNPKPMSRTFSRFGILERRPSPWDDFYIRSTRKKEQVDPCLGHFTPLNFNAKVYPSHRSEHFFLFFLCSWFSHSLHGYLTLIQFRRKVIYPYLVASKASHVSLFGKFPCILCSVSSFIYYGKDTFRSEGQYFLKGQMFVLDE